MNVRLLMATELVAEAWPSENTRELTFAPVHRAELPAWVPGDHVQLEHTNGTRRDYSLIGNTEDLSTYTIAIQRNDEGRGGSVLFHDELDVGDTAFVSYPQPGMRLDDAEKHLFIAGGIGITAVLSLLESVPEGSSSEIHYCVRSRAQAPYLDSLTDGKSTVHLHESTVGGRLDVTKVVSARRNGQSLYYCGPAGLMDEIATSTEDWPDGTVHREEFSDGGDKGKKTRRGEPFDAWLALSNKVITVSEDETLLEAMLREGVPVDYSCEGGVCGSCFVDLLEGGVEHRDLCLSEEQRATGLTACVSRGCKAIKLQC
jgi:ferredoxin-NADP reductase